MTSRHLNVPVLLQKGLTYFVNYFRNWKSYKTSYLLTIRESKYERFINLDRKSLWKFQIEIKDRSQNNNAVKSVILDSRSWMHSKAGLFLYFTDPKSYKISPLCKTRVHKISHQNCVSSFFKISFWIFLNNNNFENLNLSLN